MRALALAALLFLTAFPASAQSLGGHWHGTGSGITPGTFVAANSNNVSGASGSTAMPAGIASGDICIATNVNGQGNTGTTYSFPSGALTPLTGNAVPSLGWWFDGGWKVITGADLGGSLSYASGSTGGNSIIISCWRGPTHAIYKTFNGGAPLHPITLPSSGTITLSPSTEGTVAMMGEYAGPNTITSAGWTARLMTADPAFVGTYVLDNLSITGSFGVQTFAGFAGGTGSWGMLVELTS